MTPVPPTGWPTNEPWPPSTATHAPPQLTPTVALFPTVKAGTIESKADRLYRFWFPIYPGKNAKPVLEESRVNAKGQRASLPIRHIDIGMIEHPMYRDTALYGIFASPDRSRLVVEVAGEEMIFPHILDLTSERFLPEFENPDWMFYAWTAGGEGFYGRTRAEFNQPSGTLAKVNLNTGMHETMMYPEWDGSIPDIDALAVSANGKWLADAVTYRRTNGRNHPTTVEIGVTNFTDGKRDLICRTDQFQDPYEHSLKWSPDERRLLWIAPNLSEGVPADQTEYWLWIADVGKKQCQKIAYVRTGPGYTFHGGFSTEWSPDGHSILFIQGQSGDPSGLTGNVYLFDLNTSQARPISKYQGKMITFARFLPDSTRIAFSIRQGEYGEIWTVKLDGSDAYPIAGPTIIDAPFVWMETLEGQ